MTLICSVSKFFQHYAAKTAIGDAGKRDNGKKMQSEESSRYNFKKAVPS